jgi:DNA polymerase-3 subunit epsilon
LGIFSLVSDSPRGNNKAVREIVFDTETTGLNPAGGDRIVEIGCVEMFNRVETGRHFHAYFNPDRPMPSEAEAVHGLTNVFLSDKPRFGERCEELLEFLGDCPLVAHNASFDFGFLNHELQHCGRPPVCTTRMVDTLVLARSRHPGAKHSLDALCVRFGVDRSHRIKHGALLDAQLLAQVYVELTGGRQIGLGLVAEAGSVAVAAAARPVTIRQPRVPRPHQPALEELERHRAFISQLANPLWARFATPS